MYLMWEVSTPCVYARWFLANLGQHNTRLYVANGLAMLGTFFVARNLLGLCACPIMQSSNSRAAVSWWQRSARTCNVPKAICCLNYPCLPCRCKGQPVDLPVSCGWLMSVAHVQ